MKLNVGPGSVALCLSWWQRDPLGFREAEGSYPNEDKHKAPSSTQPRPLSLQDGRDASVLMGQLTRSVVKNHQDGRQLHYSVVKNH